MKLFENVIPTLQNQSMYDFRGQIMNQSTKQYKSAQEDLQRQNSNLQSVYEINMKCSNLQQYQASMNQVNDLRNSITAMESNVTTILFIMNDSQNRKKEQQYQLAITQLQQQVTSLRHEKEMVQSSTEVEYIMNEVEYDGQSTKTSAI